MGRSRSVRIGVLFVVFSILSLFRPHLSWSCPGCEGNEKLENSRCSLWAVVSGPAVKNPAKEILPAGGIADLKEMTKTSTYEDCKAMVQVWRKDGSKFVAIRDAKMCGTLHPFHGLAIPLNRVCGIESPGKDGGIWKFAWGIVEDVQRNPGYGTDGPYALYINPAGAKRTSDQMHIHIVLRDTKEKLPEKYAATTDLGNVWEKAKKLADEVKWSEAEGQYGVLVIADPSGGFRVYVDNGNLDRFVKKN